MRKSIAFTVCASLLCFALSLTCSRASLASELNPAEQAEVNKYISEHGRAAILRYLEVEAQDFLKAVVPKIVKEEGDEQPLVAVRNIMAQRDRVSDPKLALRYQ